MSKQRLKKLTSEVRQSIPEKIDDKEKVHALLDDLESEDPAKLKKALNVLPEFITRFEIEHPKFSQSLNEIMVVLSNMGI
ncbi:DUF4404 family protein [Caldithrix abyssi]|uniref:Uncharacterized protein n=1 Tax=Caldithrix abyssi DSM 13497 TaxID=880073 RepID=H1XV32_CALAY|nr:DUF4404 family protein [Caldithrix abyssi]APF18904.1 protein of unknown function (DUF4404) [Caldithrix abyssi DSM 13497]EHO42865.1 hypothetical protein Calab_3261 [Caldithrix abyssi DSM 13497]